jgi:hypothetical protein
MGRFRLGRVVMKPVVSFRKHVAFDRNAVRGCFKSGVCQRVGEFEVRVFDSESRGDRGPIFDGAVCAYDVNRFFNGVNVTWLALGSGVAFLVDGLGVGLERDRVGGL